MSYSEAEIKKYLEIIKKYTNLKKRNLVKPIERPIVGTVKKLILKLIKVSKFVRIADLKMNMFLAI